MPSLRARIPSPAPLPLMAAMLFWFVSGLRGAANSLLLRQVADGPPRPRAWALEEGERHFLEPAWIRCWGLCSPTIRRRVSLCVGAGSLENQVLADYGDPRDRGQDLCSYPWISLLPVLSVLSARK